MIQRRNKQTRDTFESIQLLLYPRKKQHKKRYIKMIRMVSSKDDTPCDDKAKCFAH